MLASNVSTTMAQAAAQLSTFDSRPWLKPRFSIPDRLVAGESLLDGARWQGDLTGWDELKGGDDDSDPR
jgi:hypothetical protein